MARRAELLVPGLSDGEAAHLIKLARRSRSPVVQHRATPLFASFQGQSVSQIAPPRVHASATTWRTSSMPSTPRASLLWTLGGVGAVLAGSIPTSPRRS